jgi:hypothetical protein
MRSAPHRRQRVHHACPAVALVLAHPEAASRRAESELFAGLIDREGMAIHDIVCLRLRQALGQDVEGFAAVACSRHDQLALETRRPNEMRGIPRYRGISSAFRFSTR